MLLWLALQKQRHLFCPLNVFKYLLIGFKAFSHGYLCSFICICGMYRGVLWETKWHSISGLFQNILKAGALTLSVKALNLHIHQVQDSYILVIRIPNTQWWEVVNAYN